MAKSTAAKSANGTTSKCPISREQFSEKAEAIEVKIGEMTMQVLPKHFKTKSIGWYGAGTTALRIDGKLVEVRTAVTMTIAGSKELPGFTGGEGDEE